MPSYRILNHKTGSVSSIYQHVGLIGQHWSFNFSASSTLEQSNEDRRDGSNRFHFLETKRDWFGEISSARFRSSAGHAFRDDRGQLDEGKARGTNRQNTKSFFSFVFGPNVCCICMISIVSCNCLF